MTTMSLAAYSLFPYSAALPVPAAAGVSSPVDAVQRCTPRHLDVMQNTEMAYSVTGLSLFPSVQKTVVQASSNSASAQAPSRQKAKARQSQTARVAQRSEDHQKLRSAIVTRKALPQQVTEQVKHSELSAVIKSTLASKAPGPEAKVPHKSRHSTKSQLTSVATPLVLNVTPALAPLPRYSPYDAARNTSEFETCLRRARSSTVLSIAKDVVQVRKPPAVQAHNIQRESVAWPVPPDHVNTSRWKNCPGDAPHTPSRKTNSASSENKPRSWLGTSPTAPPPSKPLPDLPEITPPSSSYLAFPCIEQRRQGGMRKHRSIGVLRSTQSIARPIDTTAPCTPHGPALTAANDLTRSKSFDRTRYRTLLPPLEVDSPPASALPDLTNDDWSPASSRLSTYSPPSDFVLAKVDFGPSSTLDKLNIDWELASSIHTAGTARDSVDWSLHPLPGASAASLESGECARRRRSRSVSRMRPPSRLVAAATRAMETMNDDEDEVTKQLSAVGRDLDIAQEHQNGVGIATSSRRRSHSSPIWQRVKAGLHLPKRLRPKSWDRIVESASEKDGQE